MAMAPSSSAGMNSVPTSGINAPAAIRTATESPMVRSRAIDGPVEKPPVSGVESTDEGELLLGLLLQDELGEDRDDEERHGQRHEERDEHGRGERGEHLPLDSLKRVERHEDDRDHQHREGHRARDLLHRLGDDPPLGRAIGPMGQVAPYVLDHHDGRVHDHAHGECEPTQRHEIRRQADSSHDDEGHEEGERQ